MNDSDYYLSLGNLFRIIKEESKNKTSALQSELFMCFFDGAIANETTINNYCVGCRRINDSYKQSYIYKHKKYQNDASIFIETVLQVLSIMDGVVYKEKDLSFINQLASMQSLTKRLYNIAKNDERVSTKIIDLLNQFIGNRCYYEAFVEMLFYIVLENKQPLTFQDIKREKIENILNDTCMSFKGLEDYLLLTFKDSVNHDFVLKNLASLGNVYANYELGTKEYSGFITGQPRYIEAFQYLKVASDAGHAGASYLIGNMWLRGFLGNKSAEDYKNAYLYLTKAVKEGSISALNSLGTMYLKGLPPLEKSVEKAIDYFQKASFCDCAYAYNNLGKLEEENQNYENAFAHYLKSANLGESWACNKVGEFYRLGLGTEKDMKKAFSYYTKALDSDYLYVSYYAYYNLAKYFYFKGEVDSCVPCDIKKYVAYLELAFLHNILAAGVELFFYYVFMYQNCKEEETWNKIMEYKSKIEKHKDFNLEWKEKIESVVLKQKENIAIDLF